MTMTEIEAAATAAWWTGKRIAIAIAIGLVTITLLIVAYFVFVAPGKAASEVTAATDAAAMAKSGTAAGQAAVGIVENNHQQGEQTDAQTRANQVIILKQPGAAVELDPALDDAGRRAICMRQSAVNLAGCNGLQQPRSP